MNDAWYDVDEIIHGGLRDELWRALVARHLAPLRGARAAIDRLLTEMGVH